jgi:hypothetical protein
MSTKLENDPKTISWNAAFDLVLSAFAVCVESHNRELIYPAVFYNFERADDNEYIIIGLIGGNDDHILHKSNNKYVFVNKNNLFFVDTNGKEFEICILISSPVIVP